MRLGLAVQAEALRGTCGAAAARFSLARAGVRGLPPFAKYAKDGARRFEGRLGFEKFGYATRRNPPAHRDKTAMNGAQLLRGQYDSSGLMSGPPATWPVRFDSYANLETKRSYQFRTAEQTGLVHTPTKPILLPCKYRRVASDRFLAGCIP